MKKLIAFLFLFLISLTTLSGSFDQWNAYYEMAAGSEEPVKENKEGKKESKEFTVNTCQNSSLVPSFICSHKLHKAFIFPQPILDQQTPPPDPAC